MASSNTSTTTTTLHSPTTPNTTFVQADPSNFRAVVQKLTGASEDPSAQKLPLTLPSRVAAAQTLRPPVTVGELMGPKKPNFKLHERRAKKLELNIGVSQHHGNIMSMYLREGMVMASPVSPLEMLTRGSPRTPKSPHEEEEEAIAEKGFYLHPTTPRASQPPQLLPLFPLHSPSSHNNTNSSYS